MSATIKRRRDEPMLSVRNLTTSFTTDSGVIQAVRDVSWDVYPGEIVGVVGESGSGKSVTVSSILGLLQSPPARVEGGPILFEDKDLLKLSQKQLRKIRGREISMIFQDPMTSFNPVKTIGRQISEAIRVHDRTVSRKAARGRAIDLLSMVGVPSPQMRYGQFPHEYSGGMRQRAMIAMAMANQPKILIADEPTTALDVTIQAQILELLQLVQEETGAATILITHDLGVIAEVADRVIVMYAGKLVESGPVLSLFEQPRHPYTRALLDSLPRIDTRTGEQRYIPGQPPSLNSPPPGCAFHPRCHLRQGRAICRVQQPQLVDVGSGDHISACHFHDEMKTAVVMSAFPDPKSDDGMGPQT